MASTTEIDPRGDVVLVCAGEGTEEKRLRVKSSFLAAASTVFKVMLGPSFREGTELSQNGAVDVQCPEDDGESMATICYIIHHQAAKVRTAPALPALVRVAQLADKYDLRDVMRPHAHCWITDILAQMSRSKTSTQRDDLDSPEEANDKIRDWSLAAAYYFGLDTIFNNLGRDIIIEGVSAVRSRRSEFRQAVDEKVVEVMEELVEERDRIRQKTIKNVENSIERELDIHREWRGSTCFLHCSFAGKRLRSVLEGLRANKLWPVDGLQDLSLQAVWARMQNLGWDDCFHHWACGPGCIAYVAPEPDWMKADFKRIAKAMRRQVTELCYECVGEGGILDPYGCDHDDDEA